TELESTPPPTTAQPDPDDADTYSGGPLLYWESLRPDRDAWQERYVDLLEKCKTKYPHPPVELQPDEVKKNGHELTRYWRDGRRRDAEIIESWHVALNVIGAMGDMQCVFHLEHHKALTIEDFVDGKLYAIDLIDKKGEVQQISAQPFTLPP